MFFFFFKCFTAGVKNTSTIYTYARTISLHIMYEIGFLFIYPTRIFVNYKNAYAINV